MNSLRCFSAQVICHLLLFLRQIVANRQGPLYHTRSTENETWDDVTSPWIARALLQSCSICQVRRSVTKWWPTALIVSKPQLNRCSDDVANSVEQTEEGRSMKTSCGYVVELLRAAVWIWKKQLIAAENRMIWSSKGRPWESWRHGTSLPQTSPKTNLTDR